MSILDLPTQRTGELARGSNTDPSAQEIAAILGISIGAFRTRCFRGDGPPGRYLKNGRAYYPFADAADWIYPIVTQSRCLLDQVIRGSRELDGCWIWSGSISASGYGQIADPRRPGSMIRTHRVTYEGFIADIPDGLDPDHLCRVRSCCNPWHIEPVSRAVNVQRGDAGGDAVRARLQMCPCGREYDRHYRTRNGGINRQCSHCRAVYKDHYNARRREGRVS